MAKFKLWVSLLLPLLLVVLVNGYDEQGGRTGWGGDDQGGEGWQFPPEEGGPHGGGGGGGGDWELPEKNRYILQDSKLVVATAAGGMRVVKGAGGLFKQSPMHIGFITMEPNTIFVPQYLDSSLILFVHRGEVRIGSIYEDELVENDLKSGDLYRIQAGSAFYLVNKGEGQRLQIIASIDTAESSDDWNEFQSFFLGGGSNPTSVLAGFGPKTLTTAFNVSYDVIGELLYSKRGGAITYLNPDHQGGDQGDRGGDHGGDEGDRGDDRRRPDRGDEGKRGDDRRRPDRGPDHGPDHHRGDDRGEAILWNRFLEQGKNERQAQMKKMLPVLRKNDENSKPTSSWRKLMNTIFGENGSNKSDKSLDSYNIYDRKPNFRNDYGWSISVDEDDYKQLRRSDIGVYLVNLSAGSMMAPHVNPTATEYGIVLKGSGNIQVVYPNGTLAMDAEVKEGDVFWIPRYFPFCQVASQSGPFIFFGFSTSAHNNWPQFLVGKGSLLETMLGPEVAAAFGLSQDRLKEIVTSQNYTTILPAAPAAPGGGGGEMSPPGSGGEDAPAGESRGKGGGGEGDVSLMEKMESKIRMKKNSFAYNMAMGME